MNEFAKLSKRLPPRPAPVNADYTVNLQRDPKDTQAAITRAQWQLFQDKWRPLEEQATAKLLESPEPAAQAAGAAVEKSYAGLGAMQQRNFGRYGVSPTADAAAVLNRRQELMRTLDVSRAENATRETINERRLEGLGQMLNLFNGVAGSAAQNGSAAAGLAAARERAYQANKAAASASRTQLIGTGLGMAAAAMMI